MKHTIPDIIFRKPASVTHSWNVENLNRQATTGELRHIGHIVSECSLIAYPAEPQYFVYLVSTSKFKFIY